MEGEDSLSELCVPSIVTPSRRCIRRLSQQIQWVNQCRRTPPSPICSQARKPRFGSRS